MVWIPWASSTRGSNVGMTNCVELQEKMRSEVTRNIQYGPVDADEELRASLENSESSVEKVAKARSRIVEMLVKLTEAHAQLLQTITMSHMAETQGGAHIVDAECRDSGKDLNQGTILIMELFERGLDSMRAVAVGTEARDHNDVTHLERALTCLDHVLCGDRFDHEPVDSDLDASGRQGGSRVGVECIVEICEVVHVNCNNE